MKKLIQLLALSLVAAVMLAVPALAQQTSASPAASPSQDEAEAKAAQYKIVTDNIRTNQPVAYEAAKQYVTKWPNDDDQIAKYLKDFVAKYEKGSRKQNFTKLLTDKKWAEAFALGKQILVDQPEDLSTSLNTSWAGLQLALSGNNANNAEAANFSQKTIQLIEAGKTLEEGKPYADKDKQEHLGWLNYSLGLYNIKNNKPNEAAAAIIKAAGYESSVKNNPVTYTQLANVYEGEYGRLQESYDATYKGKPETDESKAVLLQVKNFLEPMIDAYARAVAYSGDTPAYAQIKTAAKQRLEELYKFARGSADGMDTLIAGVKAKPLPPQPSATISAPATTGTANAPMTDSNTASGTQTGATTPATTTPTTPSTTRTNPARPPMTNTTPSPSKTPATTTPTTTNGKPMSKAPAKSNKKTPATRKSH